jgi:hypothetical protein
MDVLREKFIEENNLLWIDNRDVHYPTYEPNPAHIESSSQGKPRPGFFNLAQRFGAKLLPPTKPHRMTINRNTCESRQNHLKYYKIYILHQHTKFKCHFRMTKTISDGKS